MTTGLRPPPHGPGQDHPVGAARQRPRLDFGPMRDGLDPGALARAALPVAAIASLLVIPGLVILAAQSAGTLGFDFLAYHEAANRVLAGERLYDPTIQQTGGFGLFYYPPPFVLAVLPFALLPAATATWLWLGASMAMLVAGVALLPVGVTVRWATLLLAGLSWPVAYALKLGQVGPLLFLVWALLTLRLRAVLIGGTILVVAAAASTVLLGGIGVWQDYVALIRNVSDPITTPHNFTPGAAAYQAGVPAGLATAIQLLSSALVVAAVILAALRAPADASLLVAIVASQLLSPVLWDHYAMLLLLPVAWLLERRQWWAVLIPLVTSAVTLVVSLPAIIYPLMFWISLLGVLAVGLREGRPLAATAIAAGTPVTD